jgi:hypothetical protein
MKKRLFSSLFLFVAIMTSADMSVEVFNMARRERGLEPFIRSFWLNEMADVIMPLQIENGGISHFVIPLEEKQDRIEIFLDLLGIEVDGYWEDWECYELLGWYRGNPTFIQIAHWFDDSPVHASIFYDPRALWIGYRMELAEKDLWFIVMYVVVIHEGVDIEQLRRMPVRR